MLYLSNEASYQPDLIVPMMFQYVYSQHQVLQCLALCNHPPLVIPAFCGRQGNDAGSAGRTTLIFVR